jgi:hypothetical protein
MYMEPLKTPMGVFRGHCFYGGNGTPKHNFYLKC